MSLLPMKNSRCVCEREGGREREKAREGGWGGRRRRQRRCMRTVAFPMYSAMCISDYFRVVSSYMITLRGIQC